MEPSRYRNVETLGMRSPERLRIRSCHGAMELLLSMGQKIRTAHSKSWVVLALPARYFRMGKRTVQCIIVCDSCSISVYSVGSVKASSTG